MPLGPRVSRNERNFFSFFFLVGEEEGNASCML